jgi:hypothetical protein
MAHASWAGRTIIQLTLLGSTAAGQVVNVHHFQVGTSREATLASDQLAIDAGQELLTDWETDFLDEWRNCHTGDYGLGMMRAQVVERPGNINHRLTPYEKVPGTPAGGLVASAVEEYHSAAVIRWRTAQAGKKFRGRTYIGPIGPLWTDAGRLNSTGVTGVTAYAEALKARWAVGGSDHNDFALTVYSRPYNKFEYGYVKGQGPARAFYWPEDYDGAATNINAYAIDPVLRVQRRRQIGVGS